MKSTAHSFVWITTALSLLAVAGCGGPAYEYDAIVTGTVTVDGELAKSGTVTFHPVKGDKPSIGRIHPDGSYSLRTGQGDLREVDGGTIASGEYIVTASITGPPVEHSKAAEGAPPIPGPSLVAAKYASRDTSDLKYSVKPGKQLINLEIQAAEPVQPTPPAETAPETTEGQPADDAAPSAAGGNEAQPPGEDPSAAPPESPPATENAPAESAPTTESSAEGSTP